jgi:hypothetical protein
MLDIVLTVLLIVLLPGIFWLEWRISKREQRRAAAARRGVPERWQSEILCAVCHETQVVHLLSEPPRRCPMCGSLQWLAGTRRNDGVFAEDGANRYSTKH